MTTLQETDTRQVLGQMMGGYWMTQAIHVSAELGIADLLAGGPRTAEELAKFTDTDSIALYRLLRALASAGIFSEDDLGRFSLTPLAEPLRSDLPGSQRPFAVMMGSEFYQIWGTLLKAVRKGSHVLNETFGMPFFEYMTRNPERHDIYDAAMTGVHGAETEPMLDAYDFSAFRTVVDIGGGNGSMLSAILRRYPSVKGILFDLPPVADRARTAIAGSDLSDRLHVMGGDFFSAVPHGDAYVIRHVIHDWNDRDAVAILRNCREAMNPDGRVLVVEFVIPAGNSPSFGKWLDLMMLVVGGQERTGEQYRNLFSEAGLKLNRIIPTAHEVSVIEGVWA